MSNDDKRNIDPIQEMLRLAGNFSDLKTWGFKESYRSLKGRELIYDSEWCRFQIKFDGWEPPHQSVAYTIRIYYGRLHALNNKGSMIWNGEECYCWHGLWGGGEILNFLDGLSPSETAHRKGWPRLLKQIQEAGLTKSLTEKDGGQPEQMVRTHRHIWEHYGQRLFELFDLRRPDLWEYYRQFVKEVYDIKGRNPNIHPPFDHVC